MAWCSVKAQGQLYFFTFYLGIRKILPEKWKASIILFVRSAMKLAVIIIQGYHFYQLHIKFIQRSTFKDIIRVLSVWFSTKPINYSSDILQLPDTTEVMGVWKDTTSVIYKFRNRYDSVRKEVFYNILTQFGTYMKVIRPVNMCLYETDSKNFMLHFLFRS
jgi:hypothetical protein